MATALSSRSPGSLRLIGREVIVDFQPNGGTIRYALSGEQSEFSWTRTMDTADVTAANEPERYHVATIESLEFEMTVFYSVQVFHKSIQPGCAGILRVFPQGIGSGKQIISFEALLTDYSPSFPFDGPITVNVSGMRVGSMINDVGDVQA